MQQRQGRGSGKVAFDYDSFCRLGGSGKVAFDYCKNGFFFVVSRYAAVNNDEGPEAVAFTSK